MIILSESEDSESECNSVYESSDSEEDDKDNVFEQISIVMNIKMIKKFRK